MKKGQKIYIAGHSGMVGSAVVRLLKKKGYNNLILKNRLALDLRNPFLVKDFFQIERPEIVIMAAAQVGGIQANINNSADFLYNNLAMQNNMIHEACKNKVTKFCFLGSSCVYPKNTRQPIKEEYLMTGPLETTNEGYALAKIAGLKMVELYNKQYGFQGISIMPCNLYGTNDSFDPVNSHVLTALIKKFVDAVDSKKDTVSIWGSGNARREFMHVDDAARAIVFLMNNYDSSEIINVGQGNDISIKELADIISKKTGYRGSVVWDETKPDGMMKKCLDITKVKALGFYPKITLEEGIEKTIKEYRQIKSKM